MSAHSRRGVLGFLAGLAGACFGKRATAAAPLLPVDDRLQQVLAHEEALTGVYIETTEETIKALGAALNAKTVALATKDAAISDLVQQHARLAEAYAQVMRSKYLRDIEMRKLEDTEARLQRRVKAS